MTKKKIKSVDKSKAICPHCKAIVPTVFKKRSITLKKSKIVINNVLSGICTLCNNIVSFPSQVVKQFKKARNK